MKSRVESEMEHLLPEEHINRLTLKHPSFLMVIPISTNLLPWECYSSREILGTRLCFAAKAAHLKKIWISEELEERGSPQPLEINTEIYRYIFIHRIEYCSFMNLTTSGRADTESVLNQWKQERWVWVTFCSEMATLLLQGAKYINQWRVKGKTEPYCFLGWLHLTHTHDFNFGGPRLAPPVWNLASLLWLLLFRMLIILQKWYCKARVCLCCDLGAWASML